METKALIVTDVNTVTVGAVEVPEPAPGELLLQAQYTGISPGTELRKQTGIEGDGYPYVPGYGFCGVVLSDGPRKNQRVFARGTQKCSITRLWGGHIAHAVCAENAIYSLPDAVSSEEAALLPLAAIAYHGLRLARPTPGEVVAVIGLGPIGQCAARLYVAAGCRVLALDLSQERADLATKGGAEGIVPTGTLAEAVKARVPAGADVVVDCTGANAVLPKAIDCARDLAWSEFPLAGARFLVQGSYPGEFTIPYHPAFMRELQILLPRDCQPSDFHAVLSLMERGRFSLRDLVSAVRRPEEAQATYDELCSAKAGFVTAVFDWTETR